MDPKNLFAEAYFDPIPELNLVIKCIHTQNDLIHKDFKHLINNSVPLLILGSSLCYFFKTNYKKIFPLLYLFSGLMLWCLGRTNLHIGASGIVYALASFIFFSGLISKNKNLSALSLIVVFIYGGLFWGLFPTQ